MNARSVSLLALSVLLGACVAQQQAVDSQAGKPVRGGTQDGGAGRRAPAPSPLPVLGGEGGPPGAAK